MVWEFCSNFSANHQTHVFLRGRQIPFTEDDIRRFLGIDINLPPPGENDMFLTRVAARKNGELDMDLVYQKLIIANIDPKQHGTTFDMNHAMLIYVCRDVPARDGTNEKEIGTNDGRRCLWYFWEIVI
ncbi:hypothetical protein PIB30_096612 [Stylosanthes scabra]|uniref:Uncharacterized protein n=1 Tax=Stylosanthes scabra TaxID=79078 RepID=A0ABU6UVM3_9FABA|nr:hypothetical protein [Stylosanthes scabra]